MINREPPKDNRREMRRDQQSMPMGTAFLVSALMIYPAFSAVSVDLDRQTMRFDFQFLLQQPEQNTEQEQKIFAKLMHNLELGVRFAQKLTNVRPTISIFHQHDLDHLYSASWERDLATLADREVDSVHEMLLDFCEDHDLELEEGQMDSDQFMQFEQVFDELFQQVQEMDPSTRLRAYRDMGMIYVHRLPATEGNG